MEYPGEALALLERGPNSFALSPRSTSLISMAEDVVRGMVASVAAKEVALSAVMEVSVLAAAVRIKSVGDHKIREQFPIPSLVNSRARKMATAGVRVPPTLKITCIPMIYGPLLLIPLRM